MHSDRDRQPAANAGRAVHAPVMPTCRPAADWVSGKTSASHVSCRTLDQRQVVCHGVSYDKDAIFSFHSQEDYFFHWLENIPNERKTPSRRPVTRATTALPCFSTGQNTAMLTDALYNIHQC